MHAPRPKQDRMQARLAMQFIRFVWSSFGVRNSESVGSTALFLALVHVASHGPSLSRGKLQRFTSIVGWRRRGISLSPWRVWSKKKRSEWDSGGVGRPGGRMGGPVLARGRRRRRRTRSVTHCTLEGVERAKWERSIHGGRWDRVGLAS